MMNGKLKILEFIFTKKMFGCKFKNAFLNKLNNIGIIFNLFLLLLFNLMFMQSAYSFEDCIVMSNAKLTNIKIQNNDMIDVFPLITLMNEKNTLIVHPLKTGKTKFSILKNNNEKVVFNVEVTANSTVISDAEGFDILTIDCPYTKKEQIVEIDEPPLMYEYINGSYVELDIPPVLGGK